MKYFSVLTLCLAFYFPLCAKEVQPLFKGPFPVASTNMQIADQYHEMSDDEMHLYLLGENSLIGRIKYVADLLKYPKSAWITPINVPDDNELYGHVSGEKFDVISYVTFPTKPILNPKPYDFPYHKSNYGKFSHMLEPGEKPQLAKQDKFPLVILSHGSSAHGIYDIEHANDIARHGYIVVVITYGENRTLKNFSNNHQNEFLRPLVTKEVIDSLLNSKVFGPYIDTKNIAISGFSFGGFTALATSGGKINGIERTAHHPLISAAVVAAPWTGGVYSGNEKYAFGHGHKGLTGVDIPVLTFFGTKDNVTSSDYILPAIKKLNGETYVVELVDQTHDLQEGSWQDRNNWEIIFLNAYLKNDQKALALLKGGTSMKGGNIDRQLFEYQKKIK